MKPIEDFILDKVNEIEELSKQDDHENLCKEDLESIASEVVSTYQTQCKLFHAGGFDSPGYDIDCYVLSFIDKKGELQGVSVEIERY